MLHQSVTFLFSPTAVEARLHIRELTFDSTGSEPPDTRGEGGGGKRSRIKFWRGGGLHVVASVCMRDGIAAAMALVLPSPANKEA